MLEIFNALIACLITTITLYIAGTIIFGKSKNTTLKNIIILIISATIHTITFLYLSGMVKTIAIYILFILTFKYIFNIKFSKATLFSVIYIILLLIPDLVTLFFTTKPLNIPKETIYTSFAGSILGNLCANIIMLLMIYLLRKPLKKMLGYSFSTNKKIIIVSIITIIITAYFFFKLIAGYKVNNSVISYLMCMMLL